MGSCEPDWRQRALFLRQYSVANARRAGSAGRSPAGKGRPAHPRLKVGDTVDSWKVIIVEPEKQLALLFGMKAPGLGRLCFTLKDKGDHRELDVRAWWHPHGMPGLFYWLLMIPAHLFIFRGMAKRIALLAEEKRENN
ncbi:DUF2867 domain-containing protein [Enterobacter hormaechei]|uniref:DUF2867 domain-containing protein n=1 Tax=Enterobacter hormaechei TaxID=158836 RepID=A0A927HMH6_9ENTR|nr:DUF2867 domain-containing protein [Enterobacter hormaechei]